MSPAKTAEPMEMLFGGGVSWVCPRSFVLVGVQFTQGEEAILGVVRLIEKHGKFLFFTASPHP